MKPFIVDERVPCGLSDAERPMPRAPFMDASRPVRLAADIDAVPLMVGYRLSTPAGPWFVDDLALLARVADAGLVPRQLGDGELAQLEALNAAGLLAVDEGSGGGRLRLFDQGERHRHLYPAGGTSWFTLSPVHLELDLTNRCNQHCIHCCRNSSAHARSAGELTSRDWLHLLDEAAEIGVDEVSFLGGEPTLQPHLIELAYFARKRGIRRLNLATNALVIARELEETAAALFSTIQISLHGAKAEAHEAIVQRSGAFERVVGNVARLVARGANIVLAFTVMPSNRDQLTDMVTLSRALGVAGIRFIPLAEEGRGCQLEGLEASDYREVGALIRAAREGAPGIAITSGGFPLDEEMKAEALFYGCIAGLTKLYINARGIVGGCSLLGAEGLSMRRRSLLEIWHEGPLRAARKRLDCDCPFVARCAGGCLSVPKHNHGINQGANNG